MLEGRCEGVEGPYRLTEDLQQLQAELGDTVLAPEFKKLVTAFVTLAFRSQ